MDIILKKDFLTRGGVVKAGKASVDKSLGQYLVKNGYATQQEKIKKTKGKTK